MITVTEEPGPVLRVWVAGELLAEVRLSPSRALALAEALIAAARRSALDEPWASRPPAGSFLDGAGIAALDGAPPR